MPTVTLTPTTALHKAYDYNVGNEGLPKSSPVNAVTEFNAAKYTNVQVDDDAFYAIAAASVNIQFKFANMEQRFTFDLSAYNTGGNTITQIVVKWSGYRTAAVNDDDIVVQSKMFKDSAGAWQTDVATIQTTDAAGTLEWTKTWTAGFPLSVANILEFGLVYVLEKQFSGNESGQIRSNYVAVEVTYTTVTEKAVIVTDEDLNFHFGFEWDEITYTATVLDEDNDKLPASFVMNLRLDGVLVVSDQALDSSVYSQSTGLLTLVWYVPSGFGEGTVDLQWAEQTI